MSISRSLAMALTLALIGGGATSALAAGANSPVVTPSDLPTGGATYGVSDYTPQFNSVSGVGSGSVELGFSNAGASTALSDAFVSGALGAGAPLTQLTASSTVTVNFYINGAAGALVPIDFMGEADGSGSGFGRSSGGAFLEAFGDPQDAVTLYSFRNCGSPACGGSFDRTFNLSTGVVYSVILEAGGGVLNNPTDVTSGPASFSANVDPPNLITIDPIFAAANPGFYLAINSGYTPAPGVPEPASWALMIGGFGLAGVALRHRRRTLAAA